MNLTHDVQIDNPPFIHDASLDDLVREYAANKSEADALTARNAEIADRLAREASYKSGSNTGHLAAGGYKVTVTRRFNTKWLGEKLEEARAKLTDELFFKVFKWHYEPRSKKELDGFLAHSSPEFRAAILAAMETSPGKPGVKLEVAQ